MKFTRACLVLACCMLTPGPGHAAEASDFGYRQTSDGLPYRIFVPPGYDSGQAYPLILFLHGIGERGDDNEAQLSNHANGAMRLLDDANLAVQPVLMAAPQCPGNTQWSNAAMAGRLSSLLDEVEAEFHIDADRVYITGLSMGGFGVWYLAHSEPQRFAAVVPMSGGGSSGYAPALAHLPFWFFHAANDGTVDVSNSRRLVGALRDAGASVVYTEYASGGHGIWPRAYVTPLLFDWLTAQQRNNPGTAPPQLRITLPTSDSDYVTAADHLDLAGTADNNGYAIDAVDWDTLGGDSGAAAGISPWSIASIPLDEDTTLIRVTATGPSYYADYGGVTTFNDSLLVIGAPDLVFADGFD